MTLFTATAEETFTVETADEIIERLGLTSDVEDYELNEKGHVYTLVNGANVVVTQDATQIIFDATQWAEGEADAVAQDWNLNVEDYELNEEGHVYTLAC